MNSSKSTVASSEVFWDTIEQIYGEVPSLIKVVLQANGFDTLLAFKGIRYEDKQEFFQSVEATVVEILNSDFKSQDKTQLEQELAAQHQDFSNFKLKPGHRNYIMNLMLEIEKIDVNEFFGKSSRKEMQPKEELDQQEHNDDHFAIVQYQPENSPGKIFIPRGNDSKQLNLNQDDHVYSREDQQFIFEEEYLTDDTMDSLGIIKLDYETIEPQNRSSKRRSLPSTSSPAKRKAPEFMYNEDFIAKSMNPRRRRVTGNKAYPATDEGTRERFIDLVQQSLECILPREKLQEVEGAEISVEKDTETSWAVYCPLCNGRIRLPVVYENNGRYRNYKRSNFERHLRFKHCKASNSREIYDAVETIEETVE